MRINLLDIQHTTASVNLTLSQKRKLLNLFKEENIKMQIFRTSILVKRLRHAYYLMSDKGKEELERILKSVKLRAGHSKYVKLNFWIELTPDLCWLHGFFVGDGNILSVCRFYNADSKLVDEVNRIVNTHFNIRIKKEPNREIDYFLPKPIQIVLEELLSKKGHSVTAKIPKEFFELPLEFTSSFIRGLFDTDGTCRVDHPPRFTSASKRLVEDLKQLLKIRFDINSHIYSYPEYTPQLVLGTKKRSENFFDKLKFYEKIGFIHPRKKLALENSIKTKTIYKVLQLVRSGVKFSSEIRDILQIDRSTVINHLNNLERFGLIEKKIKRFGRNSNLKVHEWHAIK